MIKEKTEAITLLFDSKEKERNNARALLKILNAIKN